jgi:hypothetical protein
VKLSHKSSRKLIVNYDIHNEKLYESTTSSNYKYISALIFYRISPLWSSIERSTLIVYRTLPEATVSSTPVLAAAMQVHFLHYLLSVISHFWPDGMEQAAHPLAQGAELQQLAKVRPCTIAFVVNVKLMFRIIVVSHLSVSQVVPALQIACALTDLPAESVIVLDGLVFSKS